jgi:hypothetical protein
MPPGVPLSLFLHCHSYGCGATLARHSLQRVENLRLLESKPCVALHQHHVFFCKSDSPTFFFFFAREKKKEKREKASRRKNQLNNQHPHQHHHHPAETKEKRREKEKKKEGRGTHWWCSTASASK